MKKLTFLAVDVGKNDHRIVTKNKKKKEREAALKIKKATGARKKENPKGSETKVIEKIDYWPVNINDKREYLCIYIFTIQYCRKS